MGCEAGRRGRGHMHAVCSRCRARRTPCHMAEPSLGVARHRGTTVAPVDTSRRPALPLSLGPLPCSPTVSDRFRRRRQLWLCGKPHSTVPPAVPPSTLCPRP